MYMTKNKDLEVLSLRNVYNSIKPMIVMARLSGYFPIVNIKQGDQIVLELNYKDGIFIATGLLPLTVFVTYYVKTIINEEFDSYFPKKPFLYYTVFNVLILSYLMITCFYNRHIYPTVLKTIASIDSFIEKNVEIKLNSFSTLKTIHRCIYFFVLINFGKIFLVVFIPEIGRNQKITLSVLSLVLIPMVLEYGILVKLIFDRFGVVNNNTELLSKAQNEEDVDIYIRKVYILCHCHYELFRLVESMNKVFGLGILFFISLVMVNVLVNLNCLYTLFYRHLMITENWYKIIYFFLCFINDCFPCFAIVKMCTDLYDYVSTFFNLADFCCFIIYALYLRKLEV